MDIKDRFLEYVAYDTQSDPRSETYPSTAKQLVLLGRLHEQLLEMGLADADIDPHGYVTATLPATLGYESSPVIGLIAHVDTSPDMSGRDVKPQLVEDYDGGDIALNDSLSLRVEEFPELAFFKGHTLITTDGTTLLGADDKAGVAAIMTTVEYLLANPEAVHGPVRVGFTPDEEIGRGVDYFDVERFGARYAYTVDGGMEGELEYENFNAAGAGIKIQGRNIHPGYAKDKMINALLVAMEFGALLPAAQRPEHTGGYEGFFHLTSVEGGVESATMEYIIRDHSREKFEARKDTMRRAAEYINGRYGEGTLTLTLTDQYYNMREMVEPHPEVIEKALEAMRVAGVTPIVRPIRGGTDGSRLSYMGLPCPNIFTGGMNFHGKFEYVSLTTMRRCVATLVNLAGLWAQRQ